jgi:hypothetical protein
MTQVETVLVPLDGSGFSRSALPAAGRLAARFGAGIYLLSAVGSADEVDEREAELPRGRRPRLPGRSGGRRRPRLSGRSGGRRRPGRRRCDRSGVGDDARGGGTHGQRVPVAVADDAALYHEWIANRRRLDAVLADIGDLSRQAGECLLAHKGRAFHGPDPLRLRRDSG